MKQLMREHGACASVLLVLLSVSCGRMPSYDVVIRRGTIYDGSGALPRTADIGISNDRIAVVGDLTNAVATQEIDAAGLAIAPGFINMLSWANESLIVDGRSQGDIRQGVTLEVMGEGDSMGPLNARMKEENIALQTDIKYPIEWTTLDEYLRYIVGRGISTNVASFVGATTIRRHEIGYADRAPTSDEMSRMTALVRQAMEEGALGIGSSLIYAPAFYAKTNELIELCRVAAEFGGMYISHIRSEGNALLEAVDELIRIAKEAGVPAEIYHLKAAGATNWNKLQQVIDRIDSARASGVRITADMYTYPAGATGLDASMPPWVQEGGLAQWRKRLQDPAVRRRVRREMTTPTTAWENLYLGAGSADKVLLLSFKNKSLKQFTGKTLADVARMRGTTPEDTAMDLVIEDDSRVGTAYFLMSEDNIRKQVALPWVSFGSDEESSSPEGVFTLYQQHPRAYGNFARVLAKYVRDEKTMPLETAIRKLAALPAENLGLTQRGHLQPGYFADIVIFDPVKIQDHATFDDPRQYATGMVHVFVNGVQVLRDGEHTGAKPGRVVRGRGWKGQ
jgi:N-acyl-D-aspartate/D-glutamate deacylase